MLTVDASSVDRFSRTLSLYAGVARKTGAEVLAKKGNDVRVQLWKGFTERRFGGSRRAGIAARELRARSRAGIGTTVRARFLGSSSTAAAVDKNGKPLSDWQKLVAQEIATRQQGIGMLGASFLLKRYRTPRGGARFLVANTSRAAGLLMRFEGDEKSVTITAFTSGLSKVASRYGVVARALNTASADMETYLLRKLNEGPNKMLKGRF